MKCRLPIADCRLAVAWPPRSGFTLLEMLLASGITLLLMGALYVSMEVQLKYANAGREIVDQSTLARALLSRIAADISCSLTPITASKAAAGAAPAPATGGTTGSATPTTAAPDTSTTSLSAVTPLNMGVVGDNFVLTLYVSRVPPIGATAGASDATNVDQTQLGASDIRRVSYWHSTVGDGGLARQEFLRVTADDDESIMPPGLPNEDRLIIAPEVLDVTFRYFDGNTWLDTWDGAALGADYATPVGPPRAIEIRIDLQRPGAAPGDRDGMRSYRHVVAIRAANAQPSETTDTTTPTTTGGSP